MSDRALDLRLVLEGGTPDPATDGTALVESYRRLADVFHASRVDGPDDVGWVADPAWRPSSRLAARMELEA